MQHGQLDLTLDPPGNSRRRKIFFQGPKLHKYPRCSTNIKDAGVAPADPITNFRPLFLFPLQQTMPALYQLHPRPCYPSDRGVQMETAAQAQTTVTATDPVQRWLARRSAGAPPSKKLSPPTPSLRANSAEAQRARRAPQNRPGTVSRRAPFCARSSKAAWRSCAFFA